MKKTLILFLAFSLSQLLAYSQINKEKVLDNINGWRSDGCICGNAEKRPANELIWDDKLAEIAQQYAKELDTENKKNNTNFLYLSHVGSDGSTLKERLEESEYYAVYCVENIACLKGNENMVIDHWMNTPTSCNNIMNRQVTNVGLARSGDFWVILFAQPKKK